MAVDEVVLKIFFATLSAIGILFNALVIIVILRNISLRTPMNYLLVNLAISDVVISIFVQPRHVFFEAFKHTDDLQGDLLCKFVSGGAFIWIGTTAQGYALITIATERFIAITYPHDLKARINIRKIKWIIPLCWAINISVNSPTLAALSFSKERNYCLEEWPSWFDPKFYVSFVFVVGTSSVVAMFTLYSLVIYSLWSSRNNNVEASQNARFKMRKRVTKMLVIITVFHAICRLPNYIFYLLAYVAPGATYGSQSYEITVLFILIDTASHPFLLCLHLRSFRNGIKRLLTCGHSAVSPANPVESTVQFNMGRLNYTRQHGEGRSEG